MIKDIIKNNLGHKINTDAMENIHLFRVATGGKCQKSLTFQWLHRNFQVCKNRTLEHNNPWLSAHNVSNRQNICMYKHDKYKFEIHQVLQTVYPTDLWSINNILRPPIGIASCAWTKYLSKNLNISLTHGKFPWLFSKF